MAHQRAAAGDRDLRRVRAAGGWRVPAHHNNLDAARTSPADPPPPPGPAASGASGRHAGPSRLARCSTVQPVGYAGTWPSSTNRLHGPRHPLAPTRPAQPPVLPHHRGPRLTERPIRGRRCPAASAARICSTTSSGAVRICSRREVQQQDSLGHQPVMAPHRLLPILRRIVILPRVHLRGHPRPLPPGVRHRHQRGPVIKPRIEHRRRNLAALEQIPQIPLWRRTDPAPNLR